MAYGFEIMSHVETWKGNEFIALTSYAYAQNGRRYTVEDVRGAPTMAELGDHLKRLRTRNPKRG